MSTIPQQLDRILDLLQGPPLFAGYGPLEKTEDGPLFKGGMWTTYLGLPSTSPEWSGLRVDVVAFDQVSIKVRFFSPDGNPSREFFFQLLPVKGEQ